MLSRSRQRDQRRCQEKRARQKAGSSRITEFVVPVSGAGPVALVPVSATGLALALVPVSATGLASALVPELVPDLDSDLVPDLDSDLVPDLDSDSDSDLAAACCKSWPRSSQP
jgi:hypothetical protein